MKKVEAIIKPFKLDEVKEADKHPLGRDGGGARVRASEGAYRAVSWC